MEKDTRMAIDDLSEADIVNHLTFLMEKAAWEAEEIAWILTYLEQTDGHLLKELLYQFFIDENAFKAGHRTGFDQGNILDRLHSLLFK